MNKEIFKVGDKVYHFRYGWGTVSEIYETDFPIDVAFGGEEIELSFTKDGRYYEGEEPSLSFTEYNLITGGFSQERPEPDWSQYIGKWGKFWDDNSRLLIIDELLGIDINKIFISDVGQNWKHFQPLTEEQIKILELE